MKTPLRYLITAATLTAALWAQGAAPASQTPQPKPNTPAMKPAAKTAAPAPKAAAQPAAKPEAKSAAAKPAKKAAKKDVTSEVAAKVDEKATKPSAAKEQTTETKTRTLARRDPFVNPIKLQQDKAGSSSCGSGVRCLVIEQINLKGIIKTQQGMIAMIENESKRSYNLHEKDVVFNGTVVKINPDSVVFREQVTDTLGRTSTKEVVKRVTAPVV